MHRYELGGTLQNVGFEFAFRGFHAETQLHQGEENAGIGFEVNARFHIFPGQVFQDYSSALFHDCGNFSQSGQFYQRVVVFVCDCVEKLGKGQDWD